MPSLSFLHFNDAYHIEPINGIGGAAHFQTAVKQNSSDNPLFIFGGDIFNPSIVSTTTRGKHMTRVLNELGVHYSVVGNHDLDFGTARLVQLLEWCNSKWLLSNLIDKTTNKPLAGAVPHDLIEWNGVKIGLIGLIEDEWIQTLASVDTTTLAYEDFITCGRRLATELKQQGAQVIVAVTHMRLPNDEKLATEVPEIDLIFGGHDHFYDCKVIGTTVVLKSGCDFSNITKVVLNLDDKTANRFQLTKIDITEKSFPADPQMQVIVDENLLTMKKKMEKVLANCCVDLDCRSAHIRVEESCISNFIADVMRNAFSADVAILNSGTIRSDTVYKAGNFTMGNLMDILPFEDNVVVIQVTGEQLLLALENGFSKVPATEGRFPALSGVKVTFDPHAEPMKRVRQVTVGNEPLVTDKLYSVCTKMYMSKGRDGYDSLVGCPYTVNEEQGPMLSCMVMNYIRALGIVNIIKDTKDQIHAKNVFHRLKFHSRRSSYATIAPKIDQRIIRL